ncbi:cytochrome c family protein [Parvularcula sp. IMCC14364]|uniref:c-type cytochrome n=1 Tax=Parvularcula sp. IMCC14364 TaxID=3067902 RepID=UPI0027407ADD|nr:cytochrome c family protein [Parvularcula sp. IMCC14364]
MADNNQDPLFGNKLAAAALTAALLFVGLPILVYTFSGGAHHGGHHGDEHHDEANPLGLAYPIEFSFDASAVAAEPEIDLGTLLANATAQRGERSAAICRSCHTFEQGGANGTGPNLHGIVGKQVASVAGFAYSGALQEFGGVWTYERLDAYLENSSSYIPGTSMAQRIRKDEKRADILAYLQSQGSMNVPFPAPAPMEPVVIETEEGDLEAIPTE